MQLNSPLPSRLPTMPLHAARHPRAGTHAIKGPLAARGPFRVSAGRGSGSAGTPGRAPSSRRRLDGLQSDDRAPESAAGRSSSSFSPCTLLPPSFSPSSALMTSFEKTVKLACKPKAAPPKAKVCLLSPEAADCHQPPLLHSSYSTSTQSSPLPGQKMAQYTTFARPCPRGSESPTSSCVRPVCPPFSGRNHAPGCVQSSHRPPYNDPQRRDRQHSPVPVLLGRPQVAQRFCWPMGR